MKKIVGTAKVNAEEAVSSNISPSSASITKSRQGQRTNSHRLRAAALQTAEFIDKWEAARLIGLSPETLKKYRLNGTLIEGIHWVRLNSKSLRYNNFMLLDWLRNQGNPQAHRETIETYLASLSHNKSKRGRRSS